MEHGRMDKASFTEICRFLKDDKCDIRECIQGVFDTALLFFPDLMCKEAAFLTNVANGVSLLGAKTAIGQSVKNIAGTFHKKSYEDFTTKYEHAQAAQVLIVFAAYFDAIRVYLPDEERKIRISSKESIELTQKSIHEYESLLKKKSNEKAEQKAKDIFDYELSMPNPVESMDKYLEDLRNFYEILNREFLLFFKSFRFGMSWMKQEGINFLR